jgi:hypothetical protein
MKCPFCEKEIGQVKSRFDCYNMANLEGNKVKLVTDGEVQISGVQALGCVECGKDLTDFLEVIDT